MDDVTILLSSHDGAGLLAHQLRSFEQQTHAAWRLRWRDDASRDGSRDVLARFSADGPPGRAAPLADDGTHLGIAGSFLQLLRAHLASGEAGGPVAFADQDDVWLEEKLDRGVAALRRVAPGRPGLYCARQMLVDDRLRTIGLSPAIRLPPGFPAALTQNIATGCTVMLNAPACRLLGSTPSPEAGSLHDWWAYLLVAAVGGSILFDDIPTVLYRQHSGNAVGAARSAIRRGALALRRGPAGYMTLLRAHVAGLQAVAPLLTPEARAALDEIEAALAGGIVRRWRSLRRLQLTRQTWGETLLFRAWFLLG